MCLVKNTGSALMSKPKADLQDSITTYKSFTICVSTTHGSTAHCNALLASCEAQPVQTAQSMWGCAGWPPVLRCSDAHMLCRAC